MPPKHLPGQPPPPGTPDRKVRKALYMVLERLDDHLKDDLHDLIDAAPAPVIGRTATKEELQKQLVFKKKAREFLNSLPPESGINYKSVMQQVDDELEKRQKTRRSSTSSGKKVAAAAAVPLPMSPAPKIPTKKVPRSLTSPGVKSPRLSLPSIPSMPPMSPLVGPTKSKTNDGKLKKKRSSKKIPEKDPTRLVEYLCVLDFMATCSNGPPPKPQEIIEFPAMLVNAKTGEIEGKFHCDVKPDIHPKLSDYCIELTGITQDQVDNGINLLDALEMHRDWLNDHNLISLPEALIQGDSAWDDSKRTFLYTICGDWDLKVCLANQLEHQKQQVPAAFQSWINVKWPFENMHHKKVRGIADMLKEMGLSPDSTTDSGLDDCRNLAAICKKMIHHGWVPNPTAGQGRIGTKEFWHVQSHRPWPPQPDPVSPYKMIYLIRNGQSEAEVVEGKERYTSAALKDCGLTERGIQESKDLSLLLAGEHLKNIELVVTSPLVRALHTSLLGFPEHNVVVNYDLADVGIESPENSPKPMEDILAELDSDIKDRKEDLVLDYQSLKPKKWPLPPPGKEPPTRKIQKAFQWIYMDCTEQTIAVVCHSNVIRSAIYGASATVAPDNAVPIKCQLFMSGNVVPV